MAKLTAPLLSLGAAGQLGKALVFFPWKGIKAVRTYVIPANPNTADQQTQRGYMDTAVEVWHNCTFNVIDLIAWNRYASTLEAIMSGFNSFIREWINEKLATGYFEPIKHAVISAVAATTFTVRVEKGAGAPLPTLYIGTTKTNMPTAFAAVFEGGNLWRFDVTGRVADTLYYFTVKCGTVGTDFGRLGIYQQRTAAA